MDHHFFFFFFLLGCTCSMWKFPGKGLTWELQLPAYPTATAIQDLSYVCDLHHGSPQSWILDPLSEARGGIRILIDTSQMPF